VKDLFDTAGVRTTYGSAVFADHVPDTSAPAVTLLEAAGWVNVGKANLHEFAYGVTSQNLHYGVVPNPTAPGRTSGGSSGGSAAALAAGLADGALGTDTGGSIRIPAACCGVTGFKPTFGLVAVDGVFPLAPTFDHAGPMARDVAGCVELLGALAPGFGATGVTPLGSLEDVAIGVAWADRCEPLVRERVLAAAAVFPRSEVAEFPTGDGTEALYKREIADVHAELYGESSELYGDNIRPKIDRCLAVVDAEVDAAARRREEFRHEANAALGERRLLLTPTLAFVPPPADVDELATRGAFVQFTYPFNALGWPALALPAGPAEDGLPSSVQLVGRPGDDAFVLAAGLALEAALGR
jgi:aspartyl-tRNA(Asn)/glutamyl-tRNA(Gln) amidotransferase subunit A